MRRTNLLVATPRSQSDKACLYEWFVANCALWNQITYRRRQAYFDPEGDVWAAETNDLYDDYAAVTGTGTAQQVKRKNDAAWTAFFELLDDYHTGKRETKPSPPGYWGNRREGYELRGIVRCDLYTIKGGAGKRSSLSFGVGDALKDKYGLGDRERLSLFLQGNPCWQGTNGQLELIVDETAGCLRVHHTVTVQSGYVDRLRRCLFTHTPDQGNATKTAAIDVGANNTLAVLTDSGEALVFQARPLFELFRATSLHRGELQSQLPPDSDWSARLQCCCDAQYGRRDHHRDAAVKQLADWLLAHGVTEVIVGDLSDVLSTHWVAAVNEKTHNFWSHRQLTNRIEETFAVAGIAVEEVDEGGTSSTCPYCGSEDQVTRCGDTIHCADCALEAHADLVGAGNSLHENQQTEIEAMFRPMARPAAHDLGRAWDGDRYTVTYLQWGDHEWTPTRLVRLETLGSLDQRGVSEPVSSQPGGPTDCGPHGGIFAR
jgi:putative transposase